MDDKSTFDADDTVIIADPDFENVEIGDLLIVDFMVDSSLVDSDDSITSEDNVVVGSDIRHGNFGSLITSMEMFAGSGNMGSFDPSGIGFNSSNASETEDGIAVWKADLAIANVENIRLLVAASPQPPDLGGSLTDVVMNFRNLAIRGAANPVDYLDDRSVTTDPFDFDQLFGGGSAVAGDARDLVRMTDDVKGKGIQVKELNRPLSLRFGEAFIIPQIGPSYTENLYVWATFDHVAEIVEIERNHPIFHVTKVFEDGLEEDVTVELVCNGGLPLRQHHDITGGDPEGVRFIIQNVPDDTTCVVTEIQGPQGYTPVYNGGNGCEFDHVTAADYVCEITNTAKSAEFMVTNIWELMDGGVEEMDYDVEINVSCDADILTVNGQPSVDPSGTVAFILGDGESSILEIDTSGGVATCSATEVITQSGVESRSDGCTNVSLSAAAREQCTFTNTVFFEGIPALDRFGLAFLTLMIMGLGFVGMRRFT